jgi:hypothetical protein
VNVLLWLSNTAPAVWARESESIWAYPTILFLHTFGLAMLVGFTAALEALGPGDDAPAGAKVIAAASLFLWVAVMYMGRMLPYIGNSF